MKASEVSVGSMFPTGSCIRVAPSSSRPAASNTTHIKDTRTVFVHLDGRHLQREKLLDIVAYIQQGRFFVYRGVLLVCLEASVRQRCRLQARCLPDSRWALHLSLATSARTLNHNTPTSPRRLPPPDTPGGRSTALTNLLTPTRRPHDLTAATAAATLTSSWRQRIRLTPISLFRLQQRSWSARTSVLQQRMPPLHRKQRQRSTNSRRATRAKPGSPSTLPPM